MHPKLYGRVVRFHQTLGLLQRAAAGRLTDVALDARFYDQPHMNAEFRALGGLTPREFLALLHPVGDGCRRPCRGLTFLQDVGRPPD